MSESEGSAASRVAAHYSSEADAYRDLWAPVLHPIAMELLAELPSAERVLDLGCGVGTLLPHLGAEVAVGLDASYEMIALADPRFGRLVGDVTHLPIRDASFDVAVAAFVLFHLSCPLDAVAEAGRVLRAGGTIGTVTWESDSGCPALDAWTQELDRHGAPADDSHSWHELVDSPEKITGLLREAGFREARAWNVSRTEELAPDEFIERRLRLGMAHRRLAALDPESREACVGAATARVRAMAPDAFRSERRFVLATARASGR